MSKPISISAKMTTYGRVDMLEEALYSFLRQDYEGDSELVIVNDYPLQKLHFDHPKVRIINLDETFPIIGEKENFAIEQCKYNTIYNCDDDDVFLSHHFNNINTFFPENNLLHWNKGISMYYHKIKSIANLGNCGIVYDRDYVRSIGGYPREHAGADMTLTVTIRKTNGKIVRAEPEIPSQIYNWANGSYHLSGAGRDTADRENIIIRHSRHIEKLRKEGKIPTGDIVLKPNWKRDYEVMLKDYLDDTPDLTKLNGWSISSEMFEWLTANIPLNSTILEFGSGKSTVELAKCYDVISVEHNEKWMNLTTRATYHHSPLVNGWYDPEIVSKAIKGKDIKAVIIDGPPGSGNRTGILEYIKNSPILRKAKLIIDDTHRSREVDLAVKLATIVGRKNVHMKGHEKAFDIV